MIIAPETLLLFALASLVLNLTPGPDMLYAIGRSVLQGPRAGLAAAAGNFVGTLIHTLAMVMGLSALLAASAEAMTVVRIAGAVVLVVIGIRMALRFRPALDGLHRPRAPASLGRIAVESLLVHTLNPKTAVFFLAFVPQFVRSDSSATAQAGVLGLYFAVQAAGVLAIISLLSGWAGGRLQSRASMVDVFRSSTGAALAVIGIRLAATR